MGYFEIMKQPERANAVSPVMFDGHAEQNAKTCLRTTVIFQVVWEQSDKLTLTIYNNELLLV